MNARNTNLTALLSPEQIEDRISPTTFAILPEYFIDKLSEEERENRIQSYKRAFDEAKRKLKRGKAKGQKLKGWFDIFEAGGGI